MIKAIIWVLIGYVFGVAGFALASLLSAWGSSDMTNVLTEALMFGVTWPSTVWDLLTGNLHN
jgi:hypothetical protein